MSAANVLKNNAPKFKNIEERYRGEVPGIGEFIRAGCQSRSNLEDRLDAVLCSPSRHVTLANRLLESIFGRSYEQIKSDARAVYQPLGAHFDKISKQSRSDPSKRDSVYDFYRIYTDSNNTPFERNEADRFFFELTGLSASRILDTLAAAVVLTEEIEKIDREESQGCHP